MLSSCSYQLSVNQTYKKNIIELNLYGLRVCVSYLNLKAGTHVHIQYNRTQNKPIMKHEDVT